MKVAKLRIKNFRCFGDNFEEIDLDNLTAFIGSNGSGKTSAIQALYKLFGSNERDRFLSRSDFHLPAGTDPEKMDESELIVEAWIEFPEFVAGEEEQIESTVPVFFEHLAVERTGEPPFLRIQLTASWRKNHSPEGVIESRLDFLCTDDLVVPIDSKFRHPCPNALRSKFQVIYVPAVRDPATELRFQASTLVGHLFRSVKWSNGLRTSVVEKVGDLNRTIREQGGIVRLSGMLNEKWSDFNYSNKFSKAEIGFVSLDLEDLLKGVEVSFQPSHTLADYSVQQLGDGLRSLFYLSMVCTLLELQNSVALHPEYFEAELDGPCLTLIALEEPENHLAPHLLGKTVARFTDLARLPNAQVIFTSHTPTLFRRVDPENVRHFKIDLQALDTRVKPIRLPSVRSEAFTYVKEAVRAYPELYFSRLVVLGEGDSEEIIIPRLLSCCGMDLDTEYISVVPLGGRFVNHFWRLLSDLEIPFVTLLDLDLERNTGGWTRIQYIAGQLIERGVQPEILLNTTSGPVALQDIGTWAIHNGDSSILNSWVANFERYGVYFSSPLDLDFTLLSSYTSTYKSLVELPDLGPRVPDDPEKLAAKLRSAVIQVLKSETSTATCYTAEQKELFVWYAYFFLGRSKPTTHLLFSSRISDEELIGALPASLRSLLIAIHRCLDKPIPFALSDEFDEEDWFEDEPEEEEEEDLEWEF